MHHAYLVIGQQPEKEAEALLVQLGVSASLPAEVIHYRFEHMGIDDVRTLQEAAYRTALSPGALSWHVVCLWRATHEAQHALLKLVEEPPPSTRFIISVRREGMLIPTLRSRLFRIFSATPTIAHTHNDASEFLAQSIPERMKRVSVMLQKAQEEEIRCFFEELEKTAAARWREHPSALWSNFLSFLFSAHHYMAGRAPSHKMLLECVALVAPNE